MCYRLRPFCLILFSSVNLNNSPFHPFMCLWTVITSNAFILFTFFLDSKVIIWKYLSPLVSLVKLETHFIHSFKFRITILATWIKRKGSGPSCLAISPRVCPFGSPNVMQHQVSREGKAPSWGEEALTTKTSQQMQRPLFLVKAWVMSKRAGLVMGPPVKTMHWGLKVEKRRSENWPLQEAYELRTTPMDMAGTEGSAKWDSLSPEYVLGFSPEVLNHPACPSCYFCILSLDSGSQMWNKEKLILGFSCFFVWFCSPSGHHPIPNPTKDCLSLTSISMLFSCILLAKVVFLGAIQNKIYNNEEP